MKNTQASAEFRLAQTPAVLRAGRRVAIAIASALVLAACAELPVAMTSEGNYRIEATAEECISRIAQDAKAQLQEKAEQFCDEQDRHLEMIESVGTDGTIRQPCASAQLQFVCAAE